MNLKDLGYLVALAEAKHFRKAAEACFVSQPTLSGQIKKLEQELGLILIERTSRQVIFTDIGQQVVRQAKVILAEVKQLDAIASMAKGELQGAIHIGLIPTLGPYLLPHIIPALKQQFPKLKLYLYEEQTDKLLESLGNGKLDCLLLASTQDTQVFKEWYLGDEALRLALPACHPWAGEEQIEMSRLKGQTILTLGEGHCLTDHSLNYCFAAGAADDEHFKATSLETLRNMVAAEAGITLLPQLSVPKERQKDGVTYLTASNPEPKRRLVLAHRMSSPMTAWFEKIAQVIKQQLASEFTGTKRKP